MDSPTALEAAASSQMVQIQPPPPALTLIHPPRTSSLGGDPFASQPSPVMREGSVGLGSGEDVGGGGAGGSAREGMGLGLGSRTAGGPSRHVSHDPTTWIVPQVPPPLPHSIEDRIKPTLEVARKELDRYARNARLISLSLNVALGLQVLLGALITGVAAAASPKGGQISTSILGGASTLVASFLARIRGSGEPELSRERERDLGKFIRNVEAFKLDWGHERPSEDPSSESGMNRRHTELLQRVDEFRREFEGLIAAWNGEKPPAGTPLKGV